MKRERTDGGHGIIEKDPRRGAVGKTDDETTRNGRRKRAKLGENVV
jgi:hypothetical protein